MTTPQPLIKKDNHWRVEEYKREVWLAAQWLKQQAQCLNHVSKWDCARRMDCIVGIRIEKVDYAFGACRPDTEKKQ